MRDLYDWTIKLTGVVAVSGLVYQTYLFYSRRRGRGEEEINEALFFPEDTSKTFKSNQHFVKKFLQVDICFLEEHIEETVVVTVYKEGYLDSHRYPFNRYQLCERYRRFSSLKSI